MKIATATLQSKSPYSQGKYHTASFPRLPKETDKDHEIRTWRERMHYTPNGRVFIPPMAFKNCISEAAKFSSKQIPGKGKSTYTKHFEAGVLVMDALELPITKDDVRGEWRHVPSDGTRGGSKRVEKCFPVIDEWKGKVKFYILDETITEEVFTETLKEAGNFIGLGVFRPRNNGFFGRFDVVKVDWETTS